MNKINKDRKWIFAPESISAIKAEIKGNVIEEELKKAIYKTIDHYEILHRKVVIDQAGEAYYEEAEVYKPVMSIIKSKWEEALAEQEMIPFAIDKGEFLRFCYKITESGATIVMMYHHIAADGMSFSYLFQDILRLLSGEELEYKPINMFNLGEIPEEDKLNGPIVPFIDKMNEEWKKNSDVFNMESYYKAHEEYWNNHKIYIESFYLENEECERVVKYSRENKIKINTLITTALLRSAGKLSSVGHAVSIREKGFNGVGNYATGIAMKFKYDESKDFLENAKEVQDILSNKLNSSAQKYFLLQLLGKINPTLTDAIYVSSYTDYTNPIAEEYCKMFGYRGNKDEYSFNITNFALIPIAAKYNGYEITEYAIIAPLVLDSPRIICAVTLGKRMAFTLRIEPNSEMQENIEFFNRGMEYLRNI